jgi:hypothetical protein
LGDGRMAKILRAEEDGSMPHISIWRQHNETHQTLFERGVRRKMGKWEYNGGSELVQGTLSHAWNYHNDINVG